MKFYKALVKLLSPIHSIYSVKGLKAVFSILLLFFLANCHSLEVIPEPNLTQFTIKSKPICLKWNWHPFCLETKPNSLTIRGILENSNLEHKIYLDYYLDSYDSDIPVGVSLLIDGTYYNLRKAGTEYTDTLKIRSEISEDIVKKIQKTKKTISMSYSNRKETLNFEFSSGETDDFKNYLKEVTDKIKSLKKMKIVQ
ncbi:MAG: hypothetical protein KDK36_09950 [Leptospiraceae bacterium]|nr:hypothetical protein [Leptospiraceae bacterium]